MSREFRRQIMVQIQVRLGTALASDGSLERGSPISVCSAEPFYTMLLGRGKRLKVKDRLPDVNLLLNAGTRTDLRDELLQSTALCSGRSQCGVFNS
jgi:hypothetical protein